MSESAWYRRWFGEDYLTLYAHRSEDEARRQARSAVDRWGGVRPGRLLDLACGSGRHTRAFAALGIPSIGFDLSARLLRAASAFRKPKSSAPVGWARGDMRQLPFASGSFGAAASFFTSIGYFESDAENGRVIHEIARILEPGGRFVLDTLNPSPTIAHLVAEEEQVIARHRVKIRRWFDPRSRRLEKEIVFREGKSERRYIESVRAYERDELVAMLRDAGLETTACLEECEDGSLGPSGAESRRFLIFATRSGAAGACA